MQHAHETSAIKGEQNFGGLVVILGVEKVGVLEKVAIRCDTIREYTEFRAEHGW